MNQHAASSTQRKRDKILTVPNKLKENLNAPITQVESLQSNTRGTYVDIPNTYTGTVYIPQKS